MRSSGSSFGVFPYFQKNVRDWQKRMSFFTCENRSCVLKQKVSGRARVWVALYSVLGFGFNFWGFGCVPFSSHAETNHSSELKWLLLLAFFSIIFSSS